MSADSIAPNGDKASIIPLTVDFHEPMFLGGVAQENAFTLQNGFWSQLSGKQKEKAKLPWGPQNPQAMNRYAYVLSNPLKYRDPAGHETEPLEGGDDKVGYRQDKNILEIWFYGAQMKFDISKSDLVMLTWFTDFKKAADLRTDAMNQMLSALGGVSASIISTELELIVMTNLFKKNPIGGTMSNVVFAGWALGNAIFLGYSAIDFGLAYQSFDQEENKAAIAFQQLSDWSTHENPSSRIK